MPANAPNNTDPQRGAEVAAERSSATVRTSNIGAAGSSSRRMPRMAFTGGAPPSAMRTMPITRVEANWE